LWVNLIDIFHEAW